MPAPAARKQRLATARARRCAIMPAVHHPDARCELGRARRRGARRVPVPDDPPVGAGARADGDARQERRVGPERDAARVGVELVGVALGDRRAQPLDRVHEPLRVDRSGVLDRGRRQPGVVPRPGRQVDRGDGEPGQRHEGNGRAEHLADPARALTLERPPHPVGDCDADRQPGHLGEQSERHPAMILDPVRGSVRVVTGVAGRCERLLLGVRDGVRVLGRTGRARAP